MHFLTSAGGEPLVKGGHSRLTPAVGVGGWALGPVLGGSIVREAWAVFSTGTMLPVAPCGPRRYGHVHGSTVAVFDGCSPLGGRNRISVCMHGRSRAYGDPVPTATPSPSVVVSETPSPSPTPTALSDDELLAMIPEGARAENFGGAVNFASFFVNEYYVMFSTEDDRLFRALSSTDCVFCNSALTTYAKFDADGSSSEGGEPTFDTALAQGGLQDDGSYIATIPVKTAPQTISDAAGGVVKEIPETAGLASVQIRYADGHWSVLDVNLVPNKAA